MDRAPEPMLIVLLERDRERERAILLEIEHNKQHHLMNKHTIKRKGAQIESRKEVLAIV